MSTHHRRQRLAAQVARTLNTWSKGKRKQAQERESSLPTRRNRQEAARSRHTARVAVAMAMLLIELAKQPQDISEYVEKQLRHLEQIIKEGE